MLSILSSSVVERSAVNRMVVGSSPTWGVFIDFIISSQVILFDLAFFFKDLKILYPHLLFYLYDIESHHE